MGEGSDMKVLIAAVVFCVLSAAGFSYGPHEGLDCLGCHDPHYAKAPKLFKVNNEVYPNPRTGEAINGISALCLGCHNLSQFGGANIRPIFLHMTHPVNVKPNPKIAKVPEQLLRDGELQCVSCHDPHPSNPFWKYLRVDTKKGTQVGKFCAVCHPAKADFKFYGLAGQLDIKVFSSMNEAVGAKAFSLTDPQLTIENPTPNYIKAFGPIRNDLAPAYTFVPFEPWIYNPDPKNLPPDLRKLIEKPKKKKKRGNEKKKGAPGP
ncbi:MAG TPA: hypothetical protein ENJ61_07385 [Aquifex aeolicus]|uniref:Doubled CXXCH motif domain-containing protein n=1 Tax=Aquifex aeolicus TaxID=63363 RepID=A0A7C5Q2W9_AQUAO|nr:hypothetical protein [Aquifex aeolicus]